MSTSLEAGHIISWTSPKDPIKLTDLRSALSRAGFSEALAKELAARNAFSRAAKELSQERIIRRAEEGEDELKFQFTREFLQAGQFAYEKEFDLYLNKDTGRIRCENTHMEQVAQELVDSHKATRMSADVTRLIQKIFDNGGGDLVPVRQQGGCYFVPAGHVGILGGIRVLLKDIGGTLSEWEISAKSEQTQVTIQENMYGYMLGLVDKFKSSCQSISENTSSKVLERRLEEVHDLRTKLLSHAPLLRGLAEEVNAAINESELEMIGAASGQALPPPPATEETAGTEPEEELLYV